MQRYCFPVLKYVRNANGSVKIFFVASCSTLRLGNGIVSFDRDQANDGRYPAETIATFTCNPLYSLYGDNSATCETSSSWSHQTPTCNGN